jgi:phage terminase small subunit
MPRELTPKHRKFIAAIVSGKTGVDAAIEAGFSKSSAKNAAYQLTHENQAVRAELRRIATVLQAETEMDGLELVRRLEQDIEEAKALKQYGPVIKAREVQARTLGLLRDKVEVTVDRIDLSGVMAEARARRSALRPMRDLPITIDNDSVGAQAPRIVGPIDTQSTAPQRDPKTIAPRRGDDGGSFFEIGIYD